MRKNCGITTIIVEVAALAFSLAAGCSRSQGDSPAPSASANSGPSGAVRVAPAGGCPASPYTGDAIVAVVKQVDDKNATFGSPPRVGLDVLEVLQGDPNADRTQALWAPLPHDIDTGVIEKDQRYLQWAGIPMKGPKVGEKYILWGWNITQHGQTRFMAQGRETFSDRARLAALQRIERQKRQVEDNRRKVEAQEAARRSAVQQWRQTVSPEDIRRYAAAAEFVGIGKFGGAMNLQDSDMLVSFAISSILKGRQETKFAVPTYFVTFVAPRKLCDLLDRETDYVVFLRAGSGKLSASTPSYERIPQGVGIVIADKEAREALVGYIARTPASTTQPATTPAGHCPESAGA